MRRIPRALVIRGGALGDFLLTLPAVAALREVSAHLAILAYPQFAQLARAAGMVDEARCIEYGPLAAFFARGAVQNPELRDYFSSFDVILSYLYDPDGIFEENLRAAGARHIAVGPHRPDGRSHAVDHLAEPLARLGVALPDRAIKLRIETTRAAGPVIAIHPGSGSKAKNWAPANWLALVSQLLACGARVAVIAGESDGETLEALASLRGEADVEFWENLPLLDLAGKLGNASVYLGHDTGVSHLAATMGVPSVLLFGPTDPAVWAPPHAHVAVIRAPGGDMDELDTAEVLAAVRHIFPGGLLASGIGEANNPKS